MKVVNANNKLNWIGIFVFLVFICVIPKVYAITSPPEVASITNEKKMDMLEMLLNAEDDLLVIKRENFTDKVIEEDVNKMRLLVTQKVFSSIMEDITRKYKKQTDGRRVRMIEYILPTGGKQQLFGSDYNVLNTLSKQFDKRREELYQIRDFYNFISEEVQRQNGTEIFTEYDQQLFEQTALYYESGEYDLAKETATKIKVDIDLKNIRRVYEGYKILEEVKHNNFSTYLLNDIYGSAKDEIVVAYFNEILRSGQVDNETEYKNFIIELKKSADYKPGDEYVKIDYASISGIVSQINYTSIQIYRINNSFENVRNKVDFYEERGVNTSETISLFELAKTSFLEERYDEAEASLSRADSSLELGLARLAVTGVLAKEGTGFIKKHSFSLTISVFLIILLGPSILRRLKLRRVTKRINDLILENQVLIDLIKKSQSDRFSTGTIDDPTYHIKLDKYMEKIAIIKRNLPVLENIRSRYSKKTKIEKIYMGILTRLKVSKVKNEKNE